MNKKYSAFGLLKTVVFTGKAQLVLMIVFFVISLALVACSAFLGAAYGDEDYFISVFILFLCYYLPCFLLLLCLNLQGFSRFLYSAPMAKKMLTTAVPLVGTAISAVITLLAVVLTGISLAAGLVDGNRMSDVLLVCAVVSLFVQLCFTTQNSGGLGLFGCVFGFGMLAFVILSEISERGSFMYQLCRYGFGVPTAVSAAACIAAYALGIPLSLWLAKKDYRRRSSKRMVNLTPTN
ncbi:MAG: hypothetical protein K2N29_06820 [Ruminiclostridium sp.]|nr:hypothetical protein [Ruminiclostridium sp.]